MFNCLDGELSENKKQTNTPLCSPPPRTRRERSVTKSCANAPESRRGFFSVGEGGGDAPLARKLNLSPLKLRRQHLETSPSLARPNPKQDAAPKALPCSLPAPTSSTPSVKGTAAWTATGGNEVSKLSDMAALSFENWLKSGAEGAASADAAAAACTSKNVARYSVDVKSACKRIDSGAAAAENAEVAENAASVPRRTGAGWTTPSSTRSPTRAAPRRAGLRRRRKGQTPPSLPRPRSPPLRLPPLRLPLLPFGPRQGRGHAPRARVAAAAEGVGRRVARAAEAARERDLVCRGKERPLFFPLRLFPRGRVLRRVFFSLPPTRALEASTSTHPSNGMKHNKKKRPRPRRRPSSRRP